MNLRLCLWILKKDTLLEGIDGEEIVSKYISSYHHVYFKYLTILVINYTSIKLKFKKETKN